MRWRSGWTEPVNVNVKNTGAVESLLLPLSRLVSAVPGNHACYRTHSCHVTLLPACQPTSQPLGEYMILSVSVSCTITLFACRWVSVRKKTSAAARGRREHAGAPKVSIYPDIQNGGIDTLLRVEESKTGSESIDKKHDLRPSIRA